MKPIFILTLLALITINWGCAKSDDANPATAANYDTENKIFRVIVSANGAPFDVTLSQIRPSSSAKPYNLIQGEQNSEFNYGFPTQVGDTIKVITQSATGTLNVYVGYSGASLGAVTIKSTPSGGSNSEFDYVVKN